MVICGKGIVFFFSLKKFIFTTLLEKIDWMNEKAVFFSGDRKKKQPSDRMNEWAHELFQKKKLQKNSGKKIQPSYV